MTPLFVQFGMAGAITTGMPVLMDTLRALPGASLPFLTGEGTNCGSSFSADFSPTLAPANRSVVHGNALAGGSLPLQSFVDDVRGSAQS